MSGNVLDLLYPIFHISEYDLLDGIFESKMQRQWWVLCWPETRWRPTIWNIGDVVKRIEWLGHTKRSTTDDLPTAASPRIEILQFANRLNIESESVPSRTSLTWTDLSAEPDAASAMLDIYDIDNERGEKESVVNRDRFEALPLQWLFVLCL